jgi:Spy/CpxP family protein refolding chaperone
MDQSKFLKTVIVVLLLINIGTLTFMWTDRSMHRGGPHPGDTAEFLTHELQFTKDQERQFDVLKKEHHRATETLRDESRLLHDHYFANLKTAVIDTVKVNELADSIVSIQKQIELVTFYHFQKVRAICTAEQQQKFDEVIDEAIRMLGPKPPPRR